MTTKPKPRTIIRRPSWPAWARWYAADADGTICLSMGKPNLSMGAGMWFIVNGNMICPGEFTTGRNWRASLRRIVDRRGKK